MPKYKICPRCELNYIKEDQDLCDVCKAQLNNSDIFEEEEEEICPLCNQNFVEPGEKYCAECLEKRAGKGARDEDAQEGPIIKLDSDEDVISLDDAIEEEEGDIDESFDDENSTYQEDDLIDEEEVEDEEDEDCLGKE